MSDLTEDEVRKLAALAKLELDQDEVSYYRSQLSQIIDFFTQLQKADDSLSDSWRSDLSREPVPERQDQVEADSIYRKVLEGAPKAVGSSFQVPRIIE